MLPFEEKPWAKTVARCVILLSVVAVCGGLALLRYHAPLDTGEITAAILILLAVIPPNIAVIRHTPRQFPASKQPLHIGH